MRPNAIRGVIPAIDEYEKDEEDAPEAFGDVIPLMIPAPTYKALSDAAARQGKRVVDVIAEAIEHVLAGG